MLKKKSIKHLSGGGFTIVELMIATAVFATVLLVALTGFLQIGRLFYKGIATTQTQETLRQVVNDISADLKATAEQEGISAHPAGGGSPYSYYCIGAYRYTFANYKGGPDDGRPVVFSFSSPAIYDPENYGHVNFGLVKDRVGDGNCPTPCVSTVGSGSAKCPDANSTQYALDKNSPTELLGNGMRVAGFDLSASPAPLYDLSVTLAYGDISELDFTTDPVSCQGNSSQQRFCAVEQLNTSIVEGDLHP